MSAKRPAAGRSRGFGTSSGYVRELIRKDQDRQHLRALLLEGAVSAPSAPADAAFLDGLRARARKQATIQAPAGRRDTA